MNFRSKKKKKRKNIKKKILIIEVFGGKAFFFPFFLRIEEAKSAMQDLEIIPILNELNEK